MRHNLDLFNNTYCEAELEDNINLFNASDWYCISFYQNLSGEFIEKHSDKVYWELISVKQKLSEEFIERNSDKISWYNISYSQKLSENFIRKHIDKMRAELLLENKYIPQEVKEEILNLKEII
jgi:hypothetical protein